MLYIKNWVSKNGKKVKAIFAKIDNKDYFVCYVR